MLEPFKGMVEQVHTVPIPDHSCFSPDDLAEIAGEHGFQAEAHEDLEAALQVIPQDCRVLIFGSLYLAGTVLAANGQVPA